MKMNKYIDIQSTRFFCSFVACIYMLVNAWAEQKLLDEISALLFAQWNFSVNICLYVLAARDVGTLGMVLAVLFGMWTVATMFSDSGLCLIGIIFICMCCVCV